MKASPSEDNSTHFTTKSVKISVSMPAPILEQAKQRARALGYPKVSHYFAFLAARDLEERAEHTRSEKQFLDSYESQ